MGKVNFCTYTKKEFIEMLQRDVKDSDVIILTTATKSMETKPKAKASFVSFQFPHEMLNEPDDIRGLLAGNIVTSVVIARNPKQTISKEYLKQLKANGGVYGYTIEQ